MQIRDAIYIGGAWRKSAGRDRFPITNPATDEKFAEVPCATAEDVAFAVDAARAAVEKWRNVPVAERVAALRRIKDGIAARSEEIAATISAEMGAPIGFSRAAQVGLALRDFAATIGAASALEDERVGSSLVSREPIGVVAAITPWNFPLHQLAAKIAPALAAGCALIVKPSELTPLSAYIFAEIVDAAELPAGVFNFVPGAAETGAALAGHPGIDMVSFTGSTRAGRAVAGLAARGLKKVALELGGKSANIVLDDADFETAIPGAVAQCFVNSGQVCAALSRLLVPANRVREVESLAVAAAEQWTLGNPADPATRLGPLVSRVQQSRVRRYIDMAAVEGARVLTGGSAQPEATPVGAYVAPTVLGGVHNAMTVGREEVFGPVLSIMSYHDEDDAVAKANDSDYGLSGGIWSAEPRRALAVGRRLRTGQVVVNGATLDVEAPFGGVKMSGYGRECGRYGVEEFVSLKSISGIRAAETVE